ncbi:DUF2231 domain-containing protein [Aureimonas phyllosphaerae]|uniref:DUF2231 domain-containing protein n=1 Tax=Aureimonas phyllosphaerae TaxID=1166078 RepID=UPI003A5BB92A
MSTLTHPPSSAASGLHGIFLSFPVALFSTALAADAAYLGSAEIQWTNFASWAIAGALVFTGLTVLFALAGWLRHIRRPGGVRRLVYLLVLAALFAVGLVNAFHHAQDGWSSVGTIGLALSAVSTLLALVAGWMFFSRTQAVEIVR